MGIFDKLKKNPKADESAAPISAGQVQAAEAKDEEKKTVAEPKAEAKPAEEKKIRSEKSVSKIYGVLLKPIITERSTDLGSMNKYVFAVDKNSNKVQVAQAVLTRYGVKPVAVNISNYDGKKVRYGRTSGKMKDWKKAIITLPEGKSINLYETVK